MHVWLLLPIMAAATVSYGSTSEETRPSLLRHPFQVRYDSRFRWRGLDQILDETMAADFVTATDEKILCEPMLALSMESLTVPPEEIFKQPTPMPSLPPSGTSDDLSASGSSAPSDEISHEPTVAPTMGSSSDSPTPGGRGSDDDEVTVVDNDVGTGDKAGNNDDDDDDGSISSPTSWLWVLGFAIAIVVCAICVLIGSKNKEHDRP